MRPIALFIIVSSRSINSLIWALMLVTIIGPGVLAGIIAIALRSIGFFAKLLYEAIEEIDESQVEAVRATGASRRAGHRLTASCRRSAGLRRHFRVPLGHQYPRVDRARAWSAPAASASSSMPRSPQLDWTQVSLILLVIIATVIVSEWVSAKVRHAII